ncbi:sigma-70 family RNA polymerase sigma factor [Sinomicrobium kalidii]|uniref:RNA polymerase sigma factor n=1 Tax=Sinomicrobium kalidii TaxID=2900738 RepID=UPI001E343D61|nr:sigma-70 family RNA polymerase sigma factor [Sinomicrobium kalidii]UGU16479.1 sigma-70 family RNA polymerase sigma factor [Sinomicrobium kalidii]
MTYKDNFDLIESLRNGEESAYAYLVKSYHRRLFTYLLALTHDHVVAEDMVQNVFLRLWEYRSRLNPDYSIQNFLYKSSYNEFVNHYKKNQRITNLEKVYIEAIGSVVNNNDVNLIERKMAIVSQGISALPDKCAKVFILSKKEGLTNIEIAEYLNLSLKTVEGHLTKAYAILRERLGDKIKSVLFLLFKEDAD